MTDSYDWGFRSTRDDSDSKSWGGRTFDIYIGEVERPGGHKRLEGQDDGGCVTAGIGDQARRGDLGAISSGMP